MSIRNLLIVGPTKSGKSTLANVLSGTNTFNENEYSTTGNYQKPVSVEWKMMSEIVYRVVDVSGIEINQKETLNEIKKLIPEGEESQVLFVTQGFGHEDINMF